MVSRKYAKDYSLENTLGPDGKLITVTVYNGDYFRFSSERQCLRRAIKYIIVSCILYWIFFWFGLFFDSGAMRQIYISLPYFCGFLPAAYLTSSVYYLIRYSAKVPEKGFTRQERDRVFERMAEGSLLTLILAFISGIALIVYYLNRAPGFSGMRDISVIVSNIGIIIAAAVIFTTKKHTKMQVIP